MVVYFYYYYFYHILKSMRSVSEQSELILCQFNFYVNLSDLGWHNWFHFLVCRQGYNDFKMLLIWLIHFYVPQNKIYSFKIWRQNNEIQFLRWSMNSDWEFDYSIILVYIYTILLSNLFEFESYLFKNLLWDNWRTALLTRSRFLDNTFEICGSIYK